MDPSPPAAGAAGTVGAPRRAATAALRAALPAWAVSRLLVLVSLVAAHLLAGHVRPADPAVRARVAQGLLAWDGGWYRTVAEHGYAAAGREALRFFPLYPLLGRWLGGVPGVGAGVALVVLAEAAALGALCLLWLLVRHDAADDALARRSVWLLALAPAAYTTVLAYADALLLAAVIGTFLAVRTGRWWWAAAAGAAAGAVRPLGLLLVVPVAVEVVRTHRSGRRGRWASQGVALAAPLAGAAAYLIWVGWRFGSPWLPFTVQVQAGHRGRLTVPLAAMWDDAVAAVHGHHLGTALHLPWVALVAVLVVVAWRRLPASYAAYATVVVAAALTSANLDSFERYALGAFPLTVAAASLLGRRWAWRTVLVASGAVMAAYATLAFCDLVVP